MSVIRNDLTSLPNWSQWFNDTTKATVGQHTLKVKAKGSGYRDSKLSTAVTFNIYSVSTTLTGCTATHESRILQHTNVVIVFTAKERFTFTNTTISTAQIKIGNIAYTPTSADTYVVSTDGTTATLTINAEAVIGNIAVTVALTEKLATPTEFTVTKGLASWNSVDKATAYEFVAVDSNNVESSIGSYTPPATAMLNNIRIWGECDAGTSHYTVNGGQQQTLTEPAFRYTKRDGAATKAWADVNAVVLNDVSNLKVSITGYDVSYVTIYDSTFTSVYHQYITQMGVDIDVTSLLQNGYYVGVYSDN